MRRGSVKVVDIVMYTAREYTVHMRRVKYHISVARNARRERASCLLRPWSVWTCHSRLRTQWKVTLIKSRNRVTQCITLKTREES